MTLSRTQTRLAAVTFALGIGLGASMGMSSAASPSQTQCEAAGGTFTKTNGTATCTISDPVGNSESSDGRSQTRDSADSEQGNLTPKDKNATTCSGPGSSKNC